jgi:hypothetical protein
MIGVVRRVAMSKAVVAEARPFPNLTIETIELTVEHSIELPTKGAIYANQVWCGTASMSWQLVSNARSGLSISPIRRGAKYTASDRQHQQL